MKSSAAAPTRWELYGLSASHVTEMPAGSCLDGVKLHPEVIEAFARLRADAAGAGFDLRVASGFRSFERQLVIWNDKARGLRPVLDAREQPIDITSLALCERVFAILRWTALPGISRHHWGTDADVFDAGAVHPEHSLRLTVSECDEGGPFAPLHRWLDARIASHRAYGFFRPYIGRGSGTQIAAEPWHLSYAPLAAVCQASFDSGGLNEIFRESGMELRELVESNREEILRLHFFVSADVYPLPWARVVARTASSASQSVEVASGI